MVRRFHRSIYDELDELRASMDYLYQLALEPADNPLLPDDTHGTAWQYAHTMNAEVAELGDDVIVTVDTIPGLGNVKLSADLINETTLRITCDREPEDTGAGGDGAPHRKRAFSLHHVIPLPLPVTKAGARLSMRNSVLDIRFKKVNPSPALNK